MKEKIGKGNCSQMFKHEKQGVVQRTTPFTLQKLLFMLLYFCFMIVYKLSVRN